MRKLLSIPLRLAVGWSLAPRLLGGIGIAMLVLLRVTIGTHFVIEGTEKLAAGNEWSSAGFFNASRGPFEERFRQLVWDHDGQLRLDRERVMTEWARYRDRIGKHYGFDDEQQRLAQENYAKAVEQYDYVIELNQNDIEEYELGRDRIAALQLDPTRRDVASLGGQRDEIRREWKAKIAPVLRQIDAITRNYEIAQNALATQAQTDAKLPLAFKYPPTGVLDTSVVDPFVPYFDTAIGVCLMIGFLTPVAALAAAGFLGSVFLSRYPPEPGPLSSFYQLIEGVACLVLAGTGAGRFAGLDFFLHLIVRKVWGTPTIEE